MTTVIGKLQHDSSNHVAFHWVFAAGKRSQSQRGVLEPPPFERCEWFAYIRSIRISTRGRITGWCGILRRAKLCNSCKVYVVFRVMTKKGITLRFWTKRAHLYGFRTTKGYTSKVSIWCVVWQIRRTYVFNLIYIWAGITGAPHIFNQPHVYIFISKRNAKRKQLLRDFMRMPTWVQRLTYASK